MADRPAPPKVPQTRASRLLRVRAVWVLPVVFGSVVILLMTTFYIGSVINPAGHLHGLPVSIVNEDTGANTGTQQFNFGKQVQSALLGSDRVSTLLSLKPTTLARAEQRMDTGKDYATIVIPADFTDSLLELSGEQLPANAKAGQPTIEVLTNAREGSEGVSLANGVIQPAITDASHEIGHKLLASRPASSGTANSALEAEIASPITLSTVAYRQLPDHTALGLSAFYTALLTMMCGFIGAMIVQASVDTALGYATTDVGPRWRQLRPLPISRWQTLLTKWVVASVVTGLLSALVLAMGAGILHMNAPDFGYLWLYCWLAAATIAVGTLALLAILGTPGQLIAMLLFVYLGLASAGGTVPVQALPGVLRLVSNVDPLRQILNGVRAILYFGARGDAGLIHGLVATVVGLIFWLIAGGAVVTWYDRRGLFRLDPDTLAYVHQAAGAYTRPASDPPPPPRISAAGDPPAPLGAPPAGGPPVARSSDG